MTATVNVGSSAPVQTVTYSVSGGSFSSPYYTISPALSSFVPGTRYVFQAAGISSAHPFDIGVTRSTNLPSSFGKAGSALSGSSGAISFTVPADYTGSTLAYYCVAHGSMTATVSITGAQRRRRMQSTVTGDTQACREYHLGVALNTDPQVHCLHAAPDGGGVCVSPFCAQYHSTCIEPGHSVAYSDCSTDIATLAPGSIGDTSGDTIACRQYHLDVAASASPEVHCLHASPSGGGICVGPETFCANYKTTCVDTGLSSAFSSCTQHFTDLAQGSAGDTSGDTKVCREYHLGVAMTTDPDVHCPHAGPDGGGVCVGPQTFCAQYQSTCVDAGLSSAYTDCAADYNAMTAGTGGDTSGDTAACREYHLGVAVTTDPSVHCPHAGPSGGSVCVGSETFCSQYQSTCVDAGHSLAYTDCATEYNAMTAGTDGDVSGDTAACREYHLGVAMTTDPSVHCPHAGPSGGDVCVPPFCATYQSTCVDAGHSLAYQNCAVELTSMSTGAEGDTTGDTIACREYHLSVAAAQDPAVHCLHASSSGGGVCVPSFCSLYETTCVVTGFGEAFADCTATYNGFATGRSGETSGNTQACRAYHLNVATTTLPDIHCPHAGPSGGNVCIGPETFCAQYQSLCVDAGLSSGYSNCHEMYAALPAGVSGDVSGDTSACREYHLGVGKQPYKLKPFLATITAVRF